MCTGRFAGANQREVCVLSDVSVPNSMRVITGDMKRTFNARSIRDPSVAAASRLTDKKAAIRTSSSEDDHRSKQVYIGEPGAMLIWVNANLQINLDRFTVACHVGQQLGRLRQSEDQQLTIGQLCEKVCSIVEK